MKTSELTGAALDWAVAMCEGFDPETLNTQTGVVYSMRYAVYRPSTDWAQGGPIIEREMIEVIPQSAALWDAMKRDQHIPNDGPTPLIAAMRCYVTHKLGNEVDVPKELTT